MQIALAASGFYDRNTNYNKNKIIQAIKENSDRADLIVFGETFLQGFEALDWNYETDVKVAVSIEDDVITAIRNAAKEQNTAVSFGFLEKAEEKIYSSQLTIDEHGNILHIFRRVSKGWREPDTEQHYAEGKHFTPFSYKGKTFSVGLCGDLCPGV